MTRALLFLTLKIFLLAQCLQAFVPSTTFQPSRATTKALFYSNDRVGRDVARSKPHVKKIETEKTIMGKKPTITKLHSLDELKYFLEEDDRLVAIKFYAPWCKSCQRLGMHFDRFAKELGDGVLHRQQVEGKIRCARVEYGSKTYKFITEQLRVQAVPTLQLYNGLNKLWEVSGKTTTSTKSLRNALDKYWGMDEDELRVHAEESDDGILQEAIEDTFFDNTPDFLNEEW